jgi:Bifunctional DNA primase/polymerase, N-terminal
MTNRVHRAALEYAGRGWPVFPCLPGRKWPAIPYGRADATTDPAQIHAWFAENPDLNLAIATGFPGPDVLDIDTSADAFPATLQLYKAGHLDGAAALIRTPSGGQHLYFRGTDQATSRLLDQGLGFHSQDSYVLAPPSKTDAGRYLGDTITSDPGYLNWGAAARLLDPSRSQQRSADPPAAILPDAARRVPHAEPELPDREAEGAG